MTAYSDYETTLVTNVTRGPVTSRGQIDDGSWVEFNTAEAEFDDDGDATTGYSKLVFLGP